MVSQCQELHFADNISVAFVVHEGPTEMHNTMTFVLDSLIFQVKLKSDARLAATDAKYDKLDHVALSGNLFRLCQHPSANFFTLNNVEPLLQL